MNLWKTFGPTATEIVKTLPEHLTEKMVANYWTGLGNSESDPKFEVFLKAYRLWHNFGVEFRSNCMVAV
jgi:hypothetical protein